MRKRVGEEEEKDEVGMEMERCNREVFGSLMY